MLFKTDELTAEVLKFREFQKLMSTAELHFNLGRYVREREKILGATYCSLIEAAWEAGVPIYTSSLGMGLTALRLQTEPQIQEIYGLDEEGHVYFIQVTDARVDTGGLSGATSQETVT